MFWLICLHIVGQLARKPRLKVHAARQIGEGLHLILGLQVGHVAHAPRHPPLPSVIASNIPPVEIVKMVVSRDAFTLFKIWSRVSFDMRIDAGSNQHDVLLALRPATSGPAIRSAHRRRRSPGMRPASTLRCASSLMPCQNLLFVLRKVAHDVRIQVEGHHGHVVLRPQLLRKRPGRIQHVHSEDIAPRRILAQQQHRDRRLRALEPFHFLLYAILINAEIRGLQSGHELVRLSPVARPRPPSPPEPPRAGSWWARLRGS